MSLQIQATIGDLGQRVPTLESYYLRWIVHHQNLECVWISALQSWRHKDVHKATKNLMEASMQLGIYYYQIP